MAVRPFYVESIIDGRETILGGGPRRKTGESTTKIYQRDKGEITCPYTIDQTSHEDENGKLILTTKILTENGDVIDTHITEY